MIFFPNTDGLKYFLYISTLGQDILYLPEDIRKIIWTMSEKIAYMSCRINNDVIMKLRLTGKGT